MILPPYDLTASEPAQCELLASFIKCMKPEIIVESGTYLGHGAIHMGRACKQIRHGHVYTADPVELGQGRLVTANRLEEWVTFHRGGFEGMIETIPEVDLAYIDGSGPGHDASLRIQHFNLVKTKLRPGGIIFVDDTKADFAPWTDGEGGASRDRLREVMDINFEWLRGLSLYVGGER